MAKTKSSGPEGDPFGGEAEIPDTGAPSESPVAGAPNDDQSAQEGQVPDEIGPQADAPVTNDSFIGTDGDVQGSLRSTRDIQNRRVVDSDAPFDYNQLPDDSTVQGNVYPPGPDYYKAMVRDAHAKQAAAQAELDAANLALSQAESDHDSNVSEATGEPIPSQPESTVDEIQAAQE